MKRLICILLLPLVLSCGTGNGDSTKKQDGGQAGNDQGVIVGTNVGEQAPEIDLKSPSGEEILLSSLRGKMVLIDFWAAWCFPCRQESPNLIRAYNEFKDKEFVNGTGFTIYGVSLDRKKEDWTTAIQNDGLIWKTHVSELEGWQSKAAEVYELTGIPMNFLIDGDGIIVAKGLRGEELAAKLASLEKE